MSSLAEPDYYLHYYVLAYDSDYEAIWAEAQRAGAELEFDAPYAPMIVIDSRHSYNSLFVLRWGHQVHRHYCHGYYRGMNENITY